ncbi:hypothetical protein [Pseudomonas sp. TWP3-2]|uniref:hypothetical protein n=1 Tax=Pseudomonas sp. TWP3-2 TaxID=2804574 RepID=UPI003CF9731B
MKRRDAPTLATTRLSARVMAKKPTLPVLCCKREHGVTLDPPALDAVNGTVLDPSLQQVVVRIAPYPGMACGDRLMLSWHGLDMDGLPYRHESIRFVSQLQLGKEVVFVVRSAHIAALDGGALEVFWTLTSSRIPTPVTSDRLQLDVGDVRGSLLPAIIGDAIRAHLDPARVTHGTSATIRPYAWMAAGDRVRLFWGVAPGRGMFGDQLIVEPFAVGQPLVFGIPPESISAHIGSEVTVRYRVEQRSTAIRESGVTRIMIAAQERGLLEAPQIVEAIGGVLDLQDANDGVTALISDAQVEEGELVYLKCDGESFSHREDREITGAMASQPLEFNVPYEFWREHVDTEVRVSFSIERLDEATQLSGVTVLRVQA